MFINCSGQGMNLSVPNVLKDPVMQIPLGPIPDNAMHIMATGFSTKVLHSYLPGHTINTKVPISMAPPLPGMISNMPMSECMHTLTSMSVLYGNKPVTRVTDMTMQNKMNGVGLTQSPSQQKVMALK